MTFVALLEFLGEREINALKINADQQDQLLSIRCLANRPGFFY